MSKRKFKRFKKGTKITIAVAWRINLIGGNQTAKVQFSNDIPKFELKPKFELEKKNELRLISESEPLMKNHFSFNC